MHADNPFGSKTDLDYYEKQIKDWLFKTINLLNCHMIKLKGNGGLLSYSHAREGGRFSSWVQIWESKLKKQNANLDALINYLIPLARDSMSSNR